MPHNKITLGIATLLVGGCIALNAGVIASSTFDTSDEGWKNGNFDGLTPSPTSVNYLASGGNPGGQIQVSDNYSWNAFLAPSDYLGNQSAAYLGTLSFDIYDTLTDSSSPSSVVMISDGTTFLYSPQVNDNLALGPPWNSMSLQFLASTGWTTSPGGSGVATEAQMQSVLSNLQVLAIQADWHNGADDVHLDNVVFSDGISTPEPVSGLLLLAGISGIAVWRRNRQ